MYHDHKCQILYSCLVSVSYHMFFRNGSQVLIHRRFFFTQDHGTYIIQKNMQTQEEPTQRKILSENLLCVYRYRTITPSSPLINAPAFLYIPGIFSLFTAAFLASAERSPPLSANPMILGSLMIHTFTVTVHPQKRGKKTV